MHGNAVIKVMAGAGKTGCMHGNAATRTVMRQEMFHAMLAATHGLRAAPQMCTPRQEMPCAAQSGAAANVHRANVHHVHPARIGR